MKLSEFLLWVDNAADSVRVSHIDCGYSEYVETLQEAVDWAEKHLKERH